MSKNVLVTGIGGNVGQGILRNIISFDLDIRLIGTNTEAVSGGNHFCDVVYKVPFSKSPEYIPSMQKICKKEKVHLIIPSTDYETYYLALVSDSLPLLSSSDAPIAKIFLNKYQTYKSFNKLSIPFAQTVLPSSYNNNFDEFIVKPIEGRGSREIYINPKNPREFSDGYVIQKLIRGSEITTAFYVTREKKLLGHITFERSLLFGLTDKCQVTLKYNKQVEVIIKRIISNFNIKGSCNMQSIVDRNGDIIPFEVNCRISGTNSIRGYFGFEDVRYALEEYLFNKTPKKPTIKKGSAVRVLTDVIYPNICLAEIKDKTTKHYIF